VLQRQFDGQRVRFEAADRAWLASLLHRLPQPSLRGLLAASATRHGPALASRSPRPPTRGRVATPPAGAGRAAAWIVVGPVAKRVGEACGHRMPDWRRSIATTGCLRRQ
jgi:hypothetical protein